MLRVHTRKLEPKLVNVANAAAWPLRMQHNLWQFEFHASASL